MSFKFQGQKTVTQDLTFKPDPSIGNLVKCYLKEVKVVENKVEKVDDNGVEKAWEYAGYTVPYLQFTFVQAKKDKSERDRILRHVENVLTFVNKDGQKVDNNALQNLFIGMNDRIVHLHEAFKNDVNYKALPDLEFEEAGTAKERLSSFKKLFTAIADAFNKGKNDKPIFIDGKGEPSLVYLKIVPDYRTKAFYTIPTYVGKGFIERAIGVPSIELTPTELANHKLVAKGVKATDTTESSLAHEELDPTVAALIGKA